VAASEQSVVLYEKGNDGVQVYCTGYTTPDLNLQSARCQDRYPKAKVMVVTAAEAKRLLSR
jgi:uncharacterized metal-binding protein YceD (DUF177 family)